MRLIDLDDDKHVFCGSDGEYEKWNIDPTAPTIEERKTGKWMRTHDGHYLCDHCGEQCADEIMGKPRDRYCKWCGADMRGET